MPGLLAFIVVVWLLVLTLCVCILAGRLLWMKRGNAVLSAALSSFRNDVNQRLGVLKIKVEDNHHRSWENRDRLNELE